MVEQMGVLFGSLNVLVCILLAFVGVFVIDVIKGLVLMEEPDGTETLLLCIVVFDVTA